MGYLLLNRESIEVIFFLDLGNIKQWL